MKIILAVALLALAFTTGFTCSKNAPDQSAPVSTTLLPEPSQEQMADPAMPAQDTPAADASGEAPPTTEAGN